MFAQEEVAEPVKVETETPAEEVDGSTKARHELELQMSHCHQWCDAVDSWCFHSVNPMLIRFDIAVSDVYHKQI